MNVREVIDYDEDDQPILVRLNLSGQGSNDHKLIGSDQWEATQERLADEHSRHFDRAKALRFQYAHLEEADDSRINSSGETIYGKELHHTLVNRIELTDALRRLPERERHRYVMYAIEEMTVREIADHHHTDEETIERSLRRAEMRLVNRIYRD